MTIEANIQNGHEPETHKIESGGIEVLPVCDGAAFHYIDNTMKPESWLKFPKDWWKPWKRIGDKRSAVIDVLMSDESNTSHSLFTMKAMPNGQLELTTIEDGRKHTDTIDLEDTDEIEAYKLPGEEINPIFQQVGLNLSCEGIVFKFPSKNHDH
jgi:hypothetical protein